MGAREVFGVQDTFFSHFSFGGEKKKKMMLLLATDSLESGGDTVSSFFAIEKLAGR